MSFISVVNLPISKKMEDAYVLATIFLSYYYFFNLCFYLWKFQILTTNDNPSRGAYIYIIIDLRKKKNKKLRWIEWELRETRRAWKTSVDAFESPTLLPRVRSRTRPARLVSDSAPAPAKSGGDRILEAACPTLNAIVLSFLSCPVSRPRTRDPWR